MKARAWFYGPTGFGSTRGSFPSAIEKEGRELLEDMDRVLRQSILTREPELTCTVMRHDHECGRPGVYQLLPTGDEIRCAKDIDVPEQF